MMAGRESGESEGRVRAAALRPAERFHPRHNHMMLHMNSIYFNRHCSAVCLNSDKMVLRLSQKGSATEEEGQQRNNNNGSPGERKEVK